MPRLSQEATATIGVGAADALGLSVADDLRTEMCALRAEARADRKAICAEARADREQFKRQILRLIRGQGVLFGPIEGWLQERSGTGDASGEALPRVTRRGPEVGNRSIAAGRNRGA